MKVRYNGDRRDRIRGPGWQIGFCGRNLADDFERRGYIVLPETLPSFLIEAWRRRALAIMKYARTVRRWFGGSELSYP